MKRNVADVCRQRPTEAVFMFNVAYAVITELRRVYCFVLIESGVCEL